MAQLSLKGKLIKRRSFTPLLAQKIHALFIKNYKKK